MHVQVHTKYIIVKQEYVLSTGMPLAMPGIQVHIKYILVRPAGYVLVCTQ
jgi:hypothetical protein